MMWKRGLRRAVGVDFARDLCHTTNECDLFNGSLF